MSISEIIDANGIPFTIAFATISFLAVFFIVVRFIKNYRAHIDLAKFLERVDDELTKGGPQAVMDYCEHEAEDAGRVVPKLFVVALQEGPNGKIAVRDAIADCVEIDVVPSLHGWMPQILVLIKTAPMVGLLGTVVGMIGAFSKIAGATKVNPSDLAKDIGMALYTTAEGLLIAIPLIFLYSYFLQRIHRFELELQRGAAAAQKLTAKVYG